MATAASILDAKRREDDGPLAALPREATVLDAARLMNDRHIGSVLVMDGGRLAGIFTERDVLVRIVAEGLDPAGTRLSEVMTIDVACAHPETLVDEMRAVMRDARIRHLPVIDGERLVGMVSIGDLNRAEREVQIETIRYLTQFMTVS